MSLIKSCEIHDSAIPCKLCFKFKLAYECDLHLPQARSPHPKDQILVDHWLANLYPSSSSAAFACAFTNSSKIYSKNMAERFTESKLPYPERNSPIFPPGDDIMLFSPITSPPSSPSPSTPPPVAPSTPRHRRRVRTHLPISQGRHPPLTSSQGTIITRLFKCSRVTCKFIHKSRKQMYLHFDASTPCRKWREAITTELLRPKSHGLLQNRRQRLPKIYLCHICQRKMTYGRLIAHLLPGANTGHGNGTGPNQAQIEYMDRILWIELSTFDTGDDPETPITPTQSQ